MVLASVGGREATFPLPHGRGDEFHRGPSAHGAALASGRYGRRPGTSNRPLNVEHRPHPRVRRCNLLG